MATQRQKKAAKKVVENGGNVSKAMRDSGYSPKTAKTPKKLTESKSWEQLMDEFLPDKQLMEHHQALLNTNRLDHMTFPLPGMHEDPLLQAVEELAKANGKKPKARPKPQSLTDDEIKAMLLELGCKVRKIVHGEQARHVYFWAPDTGARNAALGLAYKIKNKITTKVNIKDERQPNPLAGLTEEELRQIAQGGGANDPA